MNRYCFSSNAFCIYIYGALLCLGSISSAHAVQPPPDPTEQLRPFIERLVTILIDPDLQGKEKRVQRREKAMAFASEHFDFREMSKRILGKTWKMLSEEEQEDFVTLFTSLLEHAYIAKIEGYSKQKVEFKRQRIKDERAQVITHIVDQNGFITVSYTMMLKNGVWKVYDILAEGVSLVRNYMSQFREIIRKEGYASLLKQLENKVSELEQRNR